MLNRLQKLQSGPTETQLAAYEADQSSARHERAEWISIRITFPNGQVATSCTHASLSVVLASLLPKWEA